MQIFQHEINDGIAEKIKTNASISYASAVETCDDSAKSRAFKSLASVDDNDLYYTQSILVSSSWNKNDDIFDKSEVWAAKNSPEDKPTNLEHDEGTIIGHIVSNYPITEDGILIDENTPIENLPEKYHILTGAVIYRAFTTPELKERAEKLISEIENGSKYVSMECFFKGFDYGLIDKNTGTFKVLARDNNTAYLSKYLRAYGGLGEHENYKIGRVLRNITFSGKGYVDKPANPDSIIFSKDNFKFIEKNDDFTKSGVTISQSNQNSENIIMSEVTETVVADCAEATAAAEAAVAELRTQIETLQSEKNQLVVEHEEAAKKKDAEMKAKCEELDALKTELVTVQASADEYMNKVKQMMRKAALTDSGFASEEANTILEKFNSLDDETFAAMTDMLKTKKKKEEKNTMANETTVSSNISEVLENVEETTEVNLTIGGEDDNPVESTRAALVDFVYARLGKKLNKGE